MFATCLFCHAPLGRNELLETFPVGRRLAFDPAKGRLWVICGACERWNLTPLEERWEAIETAERTARAMKPSKASDEIALFAHASGLTLVRLGAPTWRETAYWRYESDLTHRHVVARGREQAAGALNSVFDRVGHVPMPTRWLFPWANLPYIAARLALYGMRAGARAAERRRLERAVASLGADDEPRAVVRKKHLLEAEIVPDGAEGPLHLALPSDGGYLDLRGGDAYRMLGLALVHLNAAGGDRGDVHEAVDLIVDRGSPDRMIAWATARAEENRKRRANFVLGARPYGWGLIMVPPIARLGLEIAAQEEIERLAVDGELAALAAMWRDAEEIAAIADELFMPGEVELKVRRMRGG